jgi:prepilin-type N-terminal cleavage/methylation domain-containing protein
MVAGGQGNEMAYGNRRSGPVRRSGFTLLELLVVISIIVILVAILLPVIGRARTAARTTATQAFLEQLSRAINDYNTDFRAYPGPLTNDQVWNDTTPPAITVFDVTAKGFVSTQADFEKQITMSENLVLGLLGGLRVDSSSSTIVYDPTMVGQGARSLNNLGNANAQVKVSKAYIETNNLIWRTDAAGNKTGQYVDDADTAKDSLIPEFGDEYADPMPILYLRAKKGASYSSASAFGPDNNSIITYDATNTNHRVGQYDLHQILGYTAQKIGVGRKTPEPVGYGGTFTGPHGLVTVNVDSALTSNPTAGLTYYYPYDAYIYFRNPALSSPQTPSAPRVNDVPQQKDAFILISAGPDRVYGTKDDLTNFGGIGQ